METQSSTSAENSLVLQKSVLEQAESASAEEGMSLSDFVNAAVAEKIAHHEHLQWLKRRKSLTQADVDEALRILRRVRSATPDEGDELPDGFDVSMRFPSESSG